MERKVPLFAISIETSTAFHICFLFTSEVRRQPMTNHHRDIKQKSGPLKQKLSVLRQKNKQHRPTKE